MPDVQEPELVESHPDQLALRRPNIPTNLNELAVLKGEGAEIIDARAQILQTLRRASIRATSPEDWLLFKAPDDAGGQIVAYLQDCGCDRVRDLWGIEVFNVGTPEKVTGMQPGEFHYLISGDGRCKLSRQVVEGMEGGRSSTDDFCKDKTGVALELAVRKAARANLDGNITRELSGLKSVPFDELVAAWNGTAKDAARCRKGRGFGSRDVRLGANPENAPDVAPPVCPHCNTPGVYRAAKGDRKAFYGCKNYEQHPQKKFIVDAAEWVAKAAKSEPQAQASTQQTEARGRSTPQTKQEPQQLRQDEIFGGRRDPGQEG